MPLEKKMRTRKPYKFLSSELLYKQLFSPVLAKDDGIDAEALSQITLNTLKQASLYRNWPVISNALDQLAEELQRKDKRLEQELFGCNFQNPLGLAAGFDKNGIAASIWEYFGFGFSEIGTVTWHQQEGNPKPRLFRLSKEKAALNRMGFNNQGAIKMRQGLERQKLQPPGSRLSIIGLNLGKSKITPLDQAAEDYSLSLKELSSFANYVVINVSSPNTPGLRKLQESQKLRQLIQKLRRLPSCPPLLVKIAPDLNDYEIDNIIEVAFEEGLAGIIAVNTSLNRLGLENRVILQTGKRLSEEQGGLSGSPLCPRAVEIIRRLRKKSGGKLPLIGVGGIDSPQSAWERISAGASLIQIYTGWIFKGPILVPYILEGLIKQINAHGFRNISEAIGSEAPWI